MKKHIISFFFILFMATVGKTQLQVSLSKSSACPNESVVVTVTWPNTSITGVSLTAANAGGAGTGNKGTSTTFTISHSGLGNQPFTLCANGTNINGPISQCVGFGLVINAAPTLTFASMVTAYCPGGTATVETTPGGNYYTISGSNFFPNQFAGNIFTLPNLKTSDTGTYVVTSVGTCTMTGTVAIGVAPAAVMAVNTGSNLCEGAAGMNFTASITNALGSQWKLIDPQGNDVAFAPGPQQVFGHFIAGPLSPLISGTYTFTTLQNFGYSALGDQDIAYCPQKITSFVNVVATNPVVISAAPSHEVCQGGNLALSANPGGQVSIAWTGPNGFSSSVTNPQINPVSLSHAGVYSVVALFTNNFTTCATTSQINIGVVPVTVPIISMPSDFCQPAPGTSLSINFTASGGSNVSEFEWFGPGFSQKSQNPQASISNPDPGNSGTYYVTAKYSGTVATCYATSLPHQLVVIPVNSISVVPPTPVCIPNNAYLNASSIGASSYAWAGPNNYVGSGPNVTVYYPDVNASGLYTVTAFFTSANLVCTSYTTVSLKVNPILKFSLTDRVMACFNSPIEVKGPSGANSYTWTSSTGYSSNLRDLAFPSVQPKNAGTYSLSVSLGSCVTTASTTIEVVTPIEFTLRPQGRTLCLGDTVTMEVGVTGGSENYAYTWNPPLYMDSPFGSFKKFVPLGTVQYNVLVHDIACPGFSVSHGVEVNVKQPPLPQLKINSTDGCAPLVLNLDPQIEKESAITTYDFGGTKQFQKEGPITYTLSDPGTYNLTIYSKGVNGCLGKYNFPYPINVRPSPGTDIYWTPERPTTSDEIVFHAASTYDPIIYQVWTFQGGVPTDKQDSLISNTGVDTTNNVSPRRKYEKFGKYPVMIVTQNDHMCFDTIVKYLDVIDDMNVYVPNAFTPNGDGINDVFGVKGQGMKSESFSMDLFNRSGRLMFSTKNINETWDGTFNGEKVKDGVYTYMIKVVGMNGEGRKEYIGQFSLIR